MLEHNSYSITTVGRSMASAATNSARTILDVATTTQVGKTVVEKTASALVGKEVVGQAAKNVIAKGMRTNMITGGIMLAAQTIPDAVKMCKERCRLPSLPKTQQVMQPE